MLSDHPAGLVAMIRLKYFRGIIQSRPGANLDPSYACEARDLKLVRGIIEPIREPVEVCHLPESPCVIGRYEASNGCCWYGHSHPCAEFVNLHSCHGLLLSAPDISPRINKAPLSEECECTDRWCPLGIPIPEGAMTVTADDQCEEHGTLRRYVVTYQRSSCFSEGAPGAMSNAVVVTSCDSTVAISNIPQPPPDACIDAINIYRVESLWDSTKGFKEARGDDVAHEAYYDTDTQSDWFLVASLPLGVTQFVDTLHSTQLGRLLTTWGFYPPEEGLTIVGETDNGSLVGFKGNMLWFSGRNTYHAWPINSRMNLDHTIVAAGVKGNMVFVATKGKPYVVDDSEKDCKEADCRTVIVGKEIAPICSKRSFFIHKDHAYWASTYRMVRMDIYGAVEDRSKYMFTSDDWQQLDPSTMRAAVWGNDMYFTTDRFSGYVELNDQRETPPGYVNLSIAPVQWFVSEGGDLYFLACGHIFRWDYGNGKMNYWWKSVPAVAEGKVRISAAKVVFDEACGEEPLGTPTLFSMFVDGRKAYTRNINKSKPFKLPQMRGLNHCVALHGNKRVREVHYGVNIKSLVRVEER